MRYEGEPRTIGRLVVQPERSNRRTDADTMIAIVPTSLSAPVASELPAIEAARVAVITLTVRSVVMGGTMLGASMLGLMIEVRM